MKTTDQCRKWNETDEFQILSDVSELNPSAESAPAENTPEQDAPQESAPSEAPEDTQQP